MLRGRTEPAVDAGGSSNSVGDTMRAGNATGHGDERPPARSGTSRALEERPIHAEENMEGSTNIALRDERDRRVGGGQVGIEDKGGVHVVAMVCELTTCPSICLCGAGANSRRQRIAYADGCSYSRIETLEVGSGGSLG